MKPAETKCCLTCGKELHGRSDKKFCDDQCRTTFNNQFKSDLPLVKTVNASLKKNRKILENILSVNKDKSTAHVAGKKLAEAGFNFTYHTHTLNTKNGMYLFCYDYGYRRLDEGYMMVVRSLDI